ncbi:hypothetical protein [Inhella gelatinilytica]|uniref:Protein TonB n=1 Tax=Inhella gelatinilytica TaxID=2795030 RepID=A0A931NFN4_9BURK|nr:hypothetical protein [Inhella gelatinilytica]MBH9553731.1 hypothetical protein [Inhella gelatinilytica]
MQFASPVQTASSRMGGLGFVVALHVLMIWALANGLLPKIIKSPPKPTDVVVLQAEPPVEPPPLPLVRDPSLPPPSQTVWIPQDPLVVHAATDHTVTASPDAVPAVVDRPSVSVTPTQRAEPTPASTPQSVGALCSQTGRPEIPALGVDGQASFRVIGTLRQGRVVDVQLTVLRGLSDRRAMRVLAQSIEHTLRETYLCGTHNGQFTQDFDFRIE